MRIKAVLKSKNNWLSSICTLHQRWHFTQGREDQLFIAGNKHVIRGLGEQVYMQCLKSLPRCMSCEAVGDLIVQPKILPGAHHDRVHCGCIHSCQPAKMLCIGFQPELNVTDITLHSRGIIRAGCSYQHQHMAAIIVIFAIWFETKQCRW